MILLIFVTFCCQLSQCIRYSYVWLNPCHRRWHPTSFDLRRSTHWSTEQPNDPEDRNDSICQLRHHRATDFKIQGKQTDSHNQSNGNLNPLEVLNVILGHIPESTIKRIVKNNLVNGIQLRTDQKLETWYLPNMSIIRHHRVRATSSKYRRLSLRSTLRRSLHE